MGVSGRIKTYPQSNISFLILNLPRPQSSRMKLIKMVEQYQPKDLDIEKVEIAEEDPPQYQIYYRFN